MLTEALTSFRTKARVEVSRRGREQGENTSKMREEGGRDMFVLRPSCEKVPDPVSVNLRMTQSCTQELICVAATLKLYRVFRMYTP